MYISILGSIATNDLLTEAARRQLGSYPKGQPGAPLISNLINEYLSRGYKVLAITIDDQLADDEPPFVYTDPLLTYVVVPKRKHTFRPNGKRPGRTADFFRFERNQMVAVLKQYKPDVVHAHWTYEYALAGLTYTPNALITVHDNARIIFNYVRTLNRFFHLLLARYVFQRGRWFTAVSPYMAGTVQQWITEPVAVVPNPVPMPDKGRHSTRSEVPTISMVVNGWDDRKNSKNALLAFKGIQQRHPNAVLWAFGTAFEPGEHADAFCREHQIPNVVLHGSTRYAEVLDKVSQSTVLLHASLEESFGMVMAEAMSFGVPVVAGKDSGAVAWVVEDGGLLVDVTKVDEMVEAVDKLLSDPVLYKRCSTNAIRIVQTRFPIEEVADQYVSLYKKHCMSPKTAKSAEASSAQLSVDPAYKG
ncbi:glycosyltransferase family 4 protein [Spirosoma fluviale]|uniref:Glycosyltransferase involved in cell wall bisynthesis n=1 Tax=Spirosoma fluviale TaxID=1597977 RepID=A0A286G948_9BACT|nr:glycosyltransferase family 4 protein [Spirosoma fluviale]SOD92018.1 Glycosyltransferase involved in cell wall bisynthesis [Spirosoma fluviale]